MIVAKCLKSLCCLVSFTTFSLHHSQSSGLGEHTNGIIKTQLAKFVEALQIPWPKALLLVLLNLISTSLGTHKLSPFEIAMGCPMYLAPDSFDPQQIKGVIVYYGKGLIASIKNNYVLVEQFFTMRPWEKKTLSIAPCNLEILSTVEDTSRRVLFNLIGKAPIRHC